MSAGALARRSQRVERNCCDESEFKKGNAKMRKKAVLTGILPLMLLALSATGCTPLTLGFNDGVNKGTSAVLSALISTPFINAINQAFPKPK
jgi:hypothetical protein